MTSEVELGFAEAGAAGATTSEDPAAIAAESRIARRRRGVRRGRYIRANRSERVFNVGVTPTARLGPRNRRHREGVDPVVHRITAVAFHPLEGDSMPFHQFDERLPQIDVRYRLTLRVPPAIATPSHPPSVSETIDDVGRIAHDMDLG